MSKDTVEDQELDAAAEAVEDTPVEDVVEDSVEAAVEEDKEEKGQKKEEEEVEEPEDNATRSKMGRRLSGLEQQIEYLTAELKAANEKKDVVTGEDEPDGDMPMTRNEIRDYINEADNKKKDVKRAYDNDYIRHAMAITDKLEAEEANEILKEMDNNFNGQYSDNGAADAEKNFYKAKIAVLEDASGKKNPLKGNTKSKVPTGVSGGDKVIEKEYKMPKLDEHAQDLIASSNFTEEQIKDALGDKKLYTSGEVNTKNI